MTGKVQITSEGIQRVLKKYKVEQAISEYIWNGFDADATAVQIDYVSNELGTITSLQVTDNGKGIHFDHLETKFAPLFESEKAFNSTPNRNLSTTHGKNGVGRLTFFQFAHNAEWKTTYYNNNKLISGYINISSETLNDYRSGLYDSPLQQNSGTIVNFTNLKINKNDIEKVIIPFLIREFCWYLELNKSSKYKILVNGQELDYSENIIKKEDYHTITHSASGLHFRVKYVQWKHTLANKEQSKFYFLNDNGKEVYKDYTTLNKKGDHFYHSVYIESSFFNSFQTKYNPSETPTQVNLLYNTKSSPEYKFLIEEINNLLKSKRRPYLQNFASILVDTYEKEGILPEYTNDWEKKYRKSDLVEAIKTLYEVQPKLFTNLNIDQKKTFVRLLDLLLDSNEKDKLFTILDAVTELEPDERHELSELFKVTHLNRVVNTIKLIKDRYDVYYKLKDLVFNHELKANEVEHLQSVIEQHYWIFGEQYSLVTSAEPKFEEALRKYIYLLTQEDTSPNINHPDKLKEMDIFACRQNIGTDRIDNIVVELKHPEINLGMTQLNQVLKYLSVIQNQPQFNATNMHWEFYLIGKRFDTSKYIENQIDTAKPHGIKSLVQSIDNGRVKVYVKKWSDVFTEFEIKHSYLDNQLKLERDKLLNTYSNADEVVASISNNFAVQPGAVDIPEI